MELGSVGDTADASLVIARLKREDALHRRARQHLARTARLLVPFSVGIELLLIASKHGFDHALVLDETARHFDIEQQPVLDAAAELLDTGEVRTVFDAVHVADAMERGVTFHAGDSKLLRPAFPTVGL